MHSNGVLYQSYITDIIKAIGAKNGISVAYRWYDMAYGEIKEEEQQEPEEIKSKIMAEYNRIGGEAE